MKPKALEDRVTELENFIKERLDYFINEKIENSGCDSQINNLKRAINSLDRRVDDVERRLSDLE